MFFKLVLVTVLNVSGLPAHTTSIEVGDHYGTKAECEKAGAQVIADIKAKSNRFDDSLVLCTAQGKYR